MPFSPQRFTSALPLTMQTFGENNPDQTFYIIYRDPPGSGFFSNVFHVLGHIQIAESLGMTPLVDMKHFRTLYNEDSPVAGTENAWQYYFEQLTPYSLDEAYESKRVIFCDGKFKFQIYEDIASASRLTNSYLRVRSEILDKVAVFQRERLTPGTTLGIHFRGGDQKTAPGHPVCPNPEQMLDKTAWLLSSYPINTIYLVSEEQRYVDLFVRQFGKRVVFTNAFRTYDDNAYHLRPYPRANHMYTLGYEVLFDTLLLANTDYLLASGTGGVASGSNVSQMAQVLNAGSYKHVELIYNGMNPPAGASLFSRAVRKGMRLLFSARRCSQRNV